MTTGYVVEVCSTFETEDGKDGMTVTCPAQYLFTPARRVIRYDEYSEEGAVMHTRVVSAAEGVDIIREGGSSLNLQLRPGKSFSRNYDLPYGTIALEYAAEYIEDSLTEEGGILTVRYRINIGGVPSVNTVKMTVRKTRRDI